ncbi:DUF5689 domain-containing protein [Lacinutrix sp. 5H-3-7-4]|uniref:DUF5689 domain-containing protein n=1 Tax=Lacinutrix sp. (strain 5H-3-7-4) TaxID=983544 RepID=UPI00020A3312|nr:DUF5689 domain-containing protein [Lacinutrix sp. 5H-3-7-4]AEH00651.1 hypothetical protein Lacal_0802 [Lacinutrix sp. 5H-3-7-4]
MNKTNKILALALGLVSVLFINSCVEDDDFSTPDLTVVPVDESSLGLFTSFSNIVAAYDAAVADGESVGVFSVENDAPIYTIGYVVSDDSAGNFFEEIIIQNTPDATDPVSDVRRGLKVEINQGDLGGYYNFGRKVFIKLNGLAVSLENGVYTLGKAEGDSSVQLEDPEYTDFILRDAEVATIIPKMVAVEDLSEEDENTFIQLSNSQIVVADKNKTYAGEDSDQFDGFRTIKNCDTDGTIDLQTSTFADFKNAQLPQGTGTIKGVYTRDFGDDFNVIVLNSTNDIDFTNPERCDPFDINDFNVVFEEDFTDGLAGWDVYNTVGTSSWNAQDFNDDFYARASAFSSGTIVNMVSYLVSPSFDFDAQEGEQLVLEIADAFNNGEPLKAYYSNDYVSGNDPSTFTWVEIGTDQIVALSDNDGFFDNEYEATGLIDLSSVSGNAVIAFVYDSNNGTISSTIDLSNVKILTPQ